MWEFWARFWLSNMQLFHSFLAIFSYQWFRKPRLRSQTSFPGLEWFFSPSFPLAGCDLRSELLQFNLPYRSEWLVFVPPTAWFYFCPPFTFSCEKYFKQLSDDLEAYAHHAGRKTVEMADLELLMRR